MTSSRIMLSTVILVVLGAMINIQAGTSREEIKEAVAGLNDKDYDSRLEAIKTVEQLVREPGQEEAQRSCLEDELTKVVTSEAPLEARQFACQMLWMIGTNRSVRSLVGALNSRETHLVEATCYALSRYPPGEVDDVLRDALGRTEGAGRVAVINVLGSRRDAESVYKLAELARGADAVADAAIVALGKIASKQVDAVAVLVELRKAGNAAQRLTATHAYLQSAQELARTGHAEEAQAIFLKLSAPDEPDLIRRGAIVGRIEVGAQDEDLAVLSELRTDERMLRATAIATIASMKRPDFGKTFAEILPRQSPEDQVLLIQALAGQDEPEVREAFIAAVNHSDESVRLAALRGLGQVGDKSTIPLLVGKLGAAGSKEAAVFSLRTLSGEGVDLTLIKTMQASEGATREALITVLGERRSKTAIPALFIETAGQEKKSAEAAYRALRDLVLPADLPALLRLLENLDNEQLRPFAERATMRAARRAKDPAESTTILIAKLQNVDQIATRQSILRVLGVVGGTDAFAALSDALTDDDASIRDTAIRAAVQAVADWPGAEVEQVLLDIYINTDVAVHRRLALQGYVRLLGQKGENAAEEIAAKYAKLAKDVQGSDEKNLLLSGLAKVKHPDALAIVGNYLADQDVRAEAAVAALTLARETNKMDRKLVVKVMKKLLEISSDEDIRDQARKILQSAPDE
jgi:HEAT repeat protein